MHHQAVGILRALLHIGGYALSADLYKSQVHVVQTVFHVTQKERFLCFKLIGQDSTVVPLLKVTLTRGHPSYEARIFCPHYNTVNRFLPLAKGHLSYVATMCSQIGWPYKRGTTVLDIHSFVEFTVLLLVTRK